MLQVCDYCKKQQELGFRYVPGEGPKTARFMLLGEGPGATEDKEGRPFVGRSGKLLDDLFHELGVHRTQFYITNAVRCRTDRNNRTPRLTELRQCRDTCLVNTLKELQNLECIICLGAAAWKSVTNDGSASVRRDRRKIRLFRGIPCVCTYHPSFILRNPISRDWVISDLEAYLWEGLYRRQPWNVEFECRTE